MRPLLSRFSQISLSAWLLVATLAGGCFGWLFPTQVGDLKFISDIFLNLIRSAIAPMLVSVLILGVASAGNARNLGRIGLKSLLFFELWNTLALLTGWAAVSLLSIPGKIPFPASTPAPAATLSFSEILVEAFPQSIVDAMARGDIMQVVVFSFLFGIAALSAGEKARPLLQFMESLAAIAFRFTHFVLYLSPPAVFAAMALAASGGKDTLGALFLFTAAAWGGLILFLFLVLFGSLALMGEDLRRFIHEIREPFLIAFATTSSAAAIPQVLSQLGKYGVPEKLTGTVAPLSLSLNLNGSTLYLMMATLFTAKAAGVSLSLDQQLLIFLSLKLTSKGVAGIPRANFVVLSALFPAFGLPMTAIGVLLGIDVLIDPVRTGVNVISHCAAPVAVAKWEGFR